MRPDARAPGLTLGEAVIIGDHVSFGANVVLHDGVNIGPGTSIGSNVVVRSHTSLGENCVVEDSVVLGKRPRLARSSSAAGRQLDRLRIGSSVTICSGAVVFAGASIGGHVIVGDQAYVRERSKIGEGSLVGRGSVIDNDVLVGQRVRIQTNVYLTAFSVVEDDVFLGPGALTTNDHTMSRHPPEMPLKGATLRRACRIGGGAVLTPGIEVGEEAFLAAGAVLTKDLPPRAVAIGVPARVVRQVGEQDLLEHWR